MSDQSLDAPGNPWRLRLGILTAAHAVGTLHSVSVLTLAPVVRPDLGLSFTQFGLLMTAYSAGQLSGTVPGGILTDRVGVGKALVLAHLIMALGAGLFTQSTGFALALLAMLIMGWGYSIMNPATGAGVLQWFPANRRATAMGVKQAGVPIGGIVAAGTLSLTVLLSWQAIFWGIAATTVLGALLSLFLVERNPDIRPARENPLAGILRIAQDRNFAVLVGTGVFLNAGQHMFFAYLTSFMREALLASQEVASTAMGVAQGLSAIGRIGWGAVSDTLFRGKRKGLIALICAVAALGFAGMTAAGAFWGALAGILFAGVLGLTIAAYASLLQTLAVETAGRSDSGAALGCITLGTAAGAMIGPPIFGAVLDWTANFNQGWLTGAVIVGAGVLFLSLCFRERS